MQTGSLACLEGVAPQALSFGAVQRATMARGAEARAAMVAAADLRLAEAGVPRTDQDMQISHEAIYRSLFIQTRGVLKKELSAQLRTARRMRHPKSHNAKSGQGHILDMVSIRERPAEIEDRAVPGHWEGDLLTGANDTHIATLVERNTRFTMLIKIPRKDTTTVVAALAKHISKLPEEFRRSLTWDQGKEMPCPQALHRCHQRPGLLL